MESSERMGRLTSAMACSGYMSDVCFVAVCSIVLCLSLMAIKWNFAPAYAMNRKLTVLPPVCKNFMLRGDAKQSAPKVGRSPSEFFEVSCLTVL